ncbi:hypothetical protein EG68_05686 [Paragonimus skrjabini miyazakii]|uniref:EF-hand domain-containing protein n=1 Tax=Paragonimus skrjabini miyazakii TaxID=59628 RepID=A0A8S9YBG5_9TREM|nr:hypothetical protein EG68_05686 [Paragonimus skrjabini miyazakii]
MASIANRFSKESHTTSATEQKVESKLNVRDLEALQEGFSCAGQGYDNKLSLTKEQFVEALGLILSRGTRQEYNELFDKIDITGDGVVDWDKFASHLLLEFYEKDDRMKKLSVPQWKDLKTLNSPHKDVIQKMVFMKHMSRYLTVSKEGLVTMWGLDMKPQRSAKATTDACRPRDLWVTDFIVMSNINKVAIAFTSKEIAFCNISIKLELTCQTKLCDIIDTPICLDHWHNPDNPNETILAWGDVGGYLNALFWSQAGIALFEKPSIMVNEREEATFSVSLNEIIQKTAKTATYLRFKVHSDWVRQVKYIPQLEAFITCATVWNSSLVISWLEKLPSVTAAGRSPNQRPEARIISRSSVFTVHQGINAFDYHEGQNQIATAGVNYHVCLWNPYVVSKPNGLLRGHMTSVVAVQFHRSKGRLLSLSRDRVLRIWDVQLQVCLQRMAGVFPKGLEVITRMLFHEDKLRLFLTFNHSLTMLEMKIKIRDRVFTHEKPLVGVVFNTTFNQVVTACQGGTISFWLLDTGQRVKNISRSHNDAELTCLVLDPAGNLFYTGSTDGTIKIWDMNGHCHHTLICFGGAHAEVGQIVILKRAVIVMGSSNHFTVFRTTNFRDHYVYPSEWKGGPEHCDDVLTGVALPPNGLITGSYDGELVVWNTNSELAARRMTQRCKRMNEEHTDFLFNVSRLRLLPTRKHIGSGSNKGANLVSCGGNGIVRFWNAYSCILIGEFIAHHKSSNIIMCVDKTNEYLATGDIEGTVKVWNIKEYCMYEGEEEVFLPPELVNEWAAHVDLISGMTFCTRFERRTFLITASTDCSVALWTLYGVKVGVFGQELRWKLELVHRDAGIVSLASTDTSPVQVPTDRMLDQEETKDPRDSTESIATPVPAFRVDNIEPFPEDATLNDICSILSGYRINAWKHTMLGKEYQEVRIAKRQRKQPQTITDLPSVASERYGKPNYGPYYYLQLSAFDPVEELEQPDFMDRPEEYFMDKDDLNSLSNPVELPVLEDNNGNTRDQHNVYNENTLKHTIDEQSLFPSCLLHFDEQMKRTNKFLNEHNLNESSQTYGYHFDDTTISDLTSSQATRAPSSRSSRLPPIKHTKSDITGGLSQKNFR